MILSIEFEIITAAILAALACAVPGTFLALGRSPHIITPISGTAVLGAGTGAVLSYGFTPWIIPVFAFASSMAGFWLINRFKNVHGTEKNISYAVSFLFMSIGILLLETVREVGYADINLILTGDLAYVPFDRLIINGTDAGPWAIYVFSLIIIFNALCVCFFYKDIKASSIDPDYAASIGMAVKKADFVIFLMTALTAAAAIRTTGIFMTAALMLAPSMTASFYAKRLSALILTSAVICAAACMTGFTAAYAAGISIAGTITAVMGVFFFFTAFLAPESGIIRKLSDKGKKGNEMRANVLRFFVWERGSIPINDIDDAKLAGALGWSKSVLEKARKKLLERKEAEITDGKLFLTPKGSRLAETFAKPEKVSGAIS